MTFIIPTINRPSLQRAVDSLLAQTDPDWEAIIVGDGRMAEVEVDHDDGRFNLGMSVRQGAAGPVRNIGLTMYDIFSGPTSVSGPSSEWIGFLDDDDRLAETYVEHLREHSEDYPWAEVIIFRMVHPQLGILPPDTGRLRQGTVGISFAMRAELRHEHKFVREDVSNLFHEDWNMIASFQEKGRRIFQSPHIDYLVRDAA